MLLMLFEEIVSAWPLHVASCVHVTKYLKAFILRYMYVANERVDRIQYIYIPNHARVLAHCRPTTTARARRAEDVVLCNALRPQCSLRCKKTRKAKR